MNEIENLEDLILNDIGAAMKQNIDKDVWLDLLKDWEHEQALAERDWIQEVVDKSDQGWKFVKVSKDTDNYHALDILEWCRTHCQGEYNSYGPEFLFKNQRDAVNFILMWS